MLPFVISVVADPEFRNALLPDLTAGLDGTASIEVYASAADAGARIRTLDDDGSAVAAMICDDTCYSDGGAALLEQFQLAHPETGSILLTDGAERHAAASGPGSLCVDRIIATPLDVELLVATVNQLLLQSTAEMSIPRERLASAFDLSLPYQGESPDLYTKVKAFDVMETSHQSKGYYMWQRQLAGPCEHVSRVWDPVTGSEREMIMVASNNYLGLTTHPDVTRAARQAVDDFGAGTGAVALLSGTTRLHKQLEERLAQFKSGDSCVLFPTGFAANVGIISALARKTDAVFLDELVHASIIDGARASGARIVLFTHSDMADLDAKLGAETRDNAKAGKLIVVDGVYSMDGDIAPLPEIVALARRHGARLMVDEAHSMGVIGATGGGVNEHFGFTGEIDLLMGTLSKTFGCTGGYCVARKEVIEYIRAYGRPYMFSTSLPPATVAAALAGLDVLEREPERVVRLRENSDRLRGTLQRAGFDTGLSETAIIPIVIGDESILQDMAVYIDAHGVYLNTVIFPAVTRENTRLRVSVMSTHTQDDLDRTAEVIFSAAKACGFLG